MNVHRMKRTARRVMLGGLGLILCLASGSCESLPFVQSNQGVVATRIDDLQIEVMTFADTYWTAVIDRLTRLADRHPELRAELHEAKISCMENAVILAAGRNPVGAMLDLTVMVTMQRKQLETEWIPANLSGRDAERMLETWTRLEAEIWRLAGSKLDEEQEQALRDLVPEIESRYEDRYWATVVRASDFAEQRRALVARMQGGGSLLSLFQLDPLAGLTPAAQELVQTRLLAERGFYWAQRLPLILSLRVQDMVVDTLEEESIQRVIAATETITESSSEFTSAAQELVGRLPDERAAALDQFQAVIATEREAVMNQLAELTAIEREAAINQLAQLTAVEREAALDQAFEGIAAEREAIFATFETEDERLRGMMSDLRDTLEAGSELAAAVNTTMESTERLKAAFTPPPDQPRAERRPFDITEYEATAAALTSTAEELNRLVLSLNELVETPGWSDRSDDVTVVTAQAQVTLEALIDRGFQRGLILIGVLLIGGFFAALAYRFTAIRLIPPRPAA